MKLHVPAVAALVFLFLPITQGTTAFADDGAIEAPPMSEAPDEVQPPAEELPPTEEPPPAEVSPPALEEPPTPVEEPPMVESPPVSPAGPPPLSQPLAPATLPPAGPSAANTPANLTGITTVPAQPLAPVEAPPEPVVEGPPTPVDESVPPASEPITQPPAPVSSPSGEDEQTFAPFSFSPQIGYAYFPESEFEYDGLSFNVDKRNSFVLKLHLDMGGDGLAFELVPLLAYQKIGGDIRSFSEDLSSGVSGSLLAAGGQMNLMFRGSWGSFFPHLGIGFHGTYLFGDGIEYGADIYGRIPAGFTWYVAKHLGIVVEFAFMLGVTGIRKKMPDQDALYADLESQYGITQNDVESIDWNDYDLESESDRTALADRLGIEPPPNAGPDWSPDETLNQIVEEQVSKVINFGRGYGFEFMVGFRFP
ncbi:MAG: hypothetical protein JXX14_12575 [Deltaproteobacteria bacterium]|nr:hypothetical protein [Deltaproteobacteria bacterium]